MPGQTNPTSWKKLGSTTILNHPRITVVEDDIELPDGNTTQYVYFANPRDSVTVIAVRGDSVLVQKEYSYPPDQVMYQFPGGAVEPGEELEEATLRELKEESGYIGKPTYLGFYFPNNRRAKSKMHVFLVQNAEECVKEGGDAEEFITSEWVTFEKLRKMMANGEIVNFSILAGMSLYDAKQHAN